MIPSLRRTAIAGVSLLAIVAFASGCDASTEPTTFGGPASGSASQPTASAATNSAVPVAPEPTSAEPTSTDGGESPTEATSAVPTEDETAQDGLPTTYRQALAVLAVLEKQGVAYDHPKRFVTPGDAVYCVLKNAYIPASCELGKGAVKDPDVCRQALSEQVGRIEFTDQGAQPQCNTDTIREPGATVVEAPALVAAGPVSCAVEERGVTCVDADTRTGFFLTPGDYATFG